jgi:hypothetical protein
MALMASDMRVQERHSRFFAHRILSSRTCRAVGVYSVQTSNMLIPILLSRKARSGTTSAILNGAEDFRKALDLMYLTLVP